MKLFSSTLLSSLAAAMVLAGVAMADVSVSQSDGQWSVEAEGEPLSEILEAIQAEAGFRLVGLDRLIDDNPVTTSFSGSLDDVLARLLDGYDYALVYGETPETEGELQRVVLLSGRAGENPDESQRVTAERVATELSEEDGERVNQLLQRQIQPLIEAEETRANGETSTSGASSTASASAGTGSGPTVDENGNVELDPETQAALAEATRRAQQDLQALVNALQAAESAQDDN